MFSVPWPLNRSEDGGGLVLLQIFLIFTWSRALNLLERYRGTISEPDLPVVSNRVQLGTCPLIGSLSRNDGDGCENVTEKSEFALPRTLSCLIRQMLANVEF